MSNTKLRVFNDLSQHNLPQLLDAGLCATINSDDPADDTRKAELRASVAAATGAV